MLASVIVFALFLWQGHKGLNLWDEGYLWYGAQRVMLGEVPVRDFMSYDPGRYYWSAAFMNLSDDNGIMALRRAVAVFQVIGLFAALVLIGQNPASRGLAYTVLSAVVLAAWMFPRHKLFDISLSILLIGVLTFLVKNPTGLRYFLTGVCVGLVAVFGRNHGVYGGMGSLGVIAWLALGSRGGPGFFRGFASWIAGVVTGFTPILLMMLLLPGFASAFWETIHFLFERKATNLPLPVPWPWKVTFTPLRMGDALREGLIGLFFIAVVIFGLAAMAWAFRQRLAKCATSSVYAISPALTASAFLALPYAHYAYSRADVGHLAQGIFPFLIGSLALFGVQPPKVKWPAALLLCGASLWVAHASHPGWQCRLDNACVEIEVSGDVLHVPPDTAATVGLLRALANEYAPNGRSFVVTPLWPGAYSLLERKSPMWAIYALHPQKEEAQRKEIERIKSARPGFVFVYDLALDGRDELRFRHTHPLIHQYILDNFKSVESSNMTPNPAYQIYIPRDGSAGKI